MSAVENRSIQVTRVLRPLRLAFLVNPRDKATVLQVIEALTCRWGGVHSAIVPRYRRRPRDFSDTVHRDLSASQIVKGYLRSFEPDFVVTADDEFLRGLDLSKRLVVPLTDFAAVDVHTGSVKWGFSAFHLYRAAYEREYQFVRRHPPRVLKPRAADPKDRLLVSALFGSFPQGKELAFFGEAYDTTFEPEAVTIEASNFLELLRSMPLAGTPLRLGSSGIKLRPESRRRPLFVLFHGRRPADVIDYWNLRALGHAPIPVPLEWMDQFVAAYAALNEAGRLHPSDAIQEDDRAVAVTAQAVPDADLKRFVELMRNAGFTIGVQRWFPPLWDEPHLRMNRYGRVHVEADEERIDVPASEGRLQFSCLSPPGAEGTLGASASWANTVRLNEWSLASDLAAVLPPDLGDVTSLLAAIGRYPRTTSSEGVVVRCDWVRDREYWTLPRGLDAFRGWLRNRGFGAELSPAGLTAHQVILALGGPEMASLVAEPELIRLLDRAARGLVETTGEAEPGVARARRQVVTYAQVQRVLHEIHRDSPEELRGHLARLVERKVLRQGLLVKCALCRQMNWYPLEGLADELTCERCLRPFPFPRGRPPERKEWAYRPHGPFSAPNFAEGAYAVALALRFFLSPRFHGDAGTWVTSMKYEDPQRGFEFDFGIWLEPHGISREPPSLVLGECKTFGSFEAVDFDRARTLVRLFPEAALVFATLRSELEGSERESLRDLLNLDARGDYLPMRGRLVVLTAHELCSSDVLGPPYSWRGKGKRFDEIAERFSGGLFELEALSAATLALHAGE